jgi:hypothetical protein
VPIGSFRPAVEALAEVPRLSERPGMTKPVLGELAAQQLEQAIKEGRQMPRGGTWQPVIMEKLQARLLLCSSRCAYKFSVCIQVVLT